MEVGWLGNRITEGACGEEHPVLQASDESLPLLNITRFPNSNFKILKKNIHVFLVYQ